MPRDEDDRDTLLGTLLSLIGRDATFNLVEKYGGQRLTVPKVPKDDCALAGTIGLSAAQALSAEFGGETLKVPLPKLWLLNIYRERGMSYPQLAGKMRVTEKTIGVWLKRLGLTKPSGSAKAESDTVACGAQPQPIEKRA